MSITASPDLQSESKNLTMRYIDALVRNLHIVEVPGARPIFVPDRVHPNDLDKLRHELDDVLSSGAAAIEDVRTNADAKLGAIGFGLVDDFELFVKVGYLLGNRLVFWDILRSSALRRINFSPEDVVTSGVIANQIVALRPLVAIGAAVVLPHPRLWSLAAMEATQLALQNPGPDPTRTIGLAVALAVCEDLCLNLYTITESERHDTMLLDPATRLQIESKAEGSDLYRTLMTALTAERLLSDKRLGFVADLPFDRFQAVVSAKTEFYREISAALSGGGRAAAAFNVESLASRVSDAVNRGWRNELASTAGPVEGAARFIELAMQYSVVLAPYSYMPKTLATVARAAGGHLRDESSPSVLIGTFVRLSME